MDTNLLATIIGVILIVAFIVIFATIRKTRTQGVATCGQYRGTPASSFSPLAQEVSRRTSIHQKEYPQEVLEKITIDAQNEIKRDKTQRARAAAAPPAPITAQDYIKETRTAAHDIGDAGESIVKRRLSGYLNYHNLTLANILQEGDKDGPTSQIDHLLIGHNGGLTIIETKNWSGTIECQRSGPVTVTSESGNVYTGKFNPIQQAERQKKFLQRALDALPKEMTEGIAIYVKVASVGRAKWVGRHGEFVVSKSVLFDYIKKFGQKRKARMSPEALRAKKIIDRLVAEDKQKGLNEIHLARMRKPENKNDMPETI